MKRKLGGPHSRYGRFGEHETLFRMRVVQINPSARYNGDVTITRFSPSQNCLTNLHQCPGLHSPVAIQGIPIRPGKGQIHYSPQFMGQKQSKCNCHCRKGQFAHDSSCYRAYHLVVQDARVRKAVFMTQENNTGKDKTILNNINITACIQLLYPNNTTCSF
jgi:hypothetical protein